MRSCGALLVQSKRDVRIVQRAVVTLTVALWDVAGNWSSPELPALEDEAATLFRNVGVCPVLCYRAETYQPLKIQKLRFFETSLYGKLPCTQRKIPEDQNSQSKYFGLTGATRGGNRIHFYLTKSIHLYLTIGIHLYLTNGIHLYLTSGIHLYLTNGVRLTCILQRVYTCISQMVYICILQVVYACISQMVYA